MRRPKNLQRSQKKDGEFRRIGRKRGGRRFTEKKKKKKKKKDKKKKVNEARKNKWVEKVQRKDRTDLHGEDCTEGRR